MPRPDLDLRELRRRLQINAPLPKEASINTHRFALALNPFRHRDRNLERALLHALLQPGTTTDEHRQALRQANCRPGRRCKSWSCFLCRQECWLVRVTRAYELADGLNRDEISWATIIAEVTHNGIDEAGQIIGEAKAKWRASTRRWPELQWLGAFEVDYALPGTSSFGTFKLPSLRALGYDPNHELGALIVHVHLLVFHPRVPREWITIPLKRAFPGLRRVDLHPLKPGKPLAENLGNCVRYAAKCLPPKAILPGRGSRYHRPRQPEHLRYFNRVMCELGGVLTFDSAPL